jgi:hypothetical protein
MSHDGAFEEVIHHTKGVKYEPLSIHPATRPMIFHLVMVAMSPNTFGFVTAGLK